MILGHAYDFRSELGDLAYNSDYESKKTEFFKENVSKFVNECDQFLGNKKKWFADKLSVADFVLYELFDVLKLMEPKCLDNSQNIISFLKRFESLPRIASYLKSDRCIKSPVNNTMAGWNP